MHNLGGFFIWPDTRDWVELLSCGDQHGKCIGYVMPRSEPATAPAGIMRQPTPRPAFYTPMDAIAAVSLPSCAVNDGW